MKMCRIITIANQKGGTGKSTTALNLGYSLAHAGNRVLMVDCDPQANLTLAYGINKPYELFVSMHNLVSSLIDGEALPEKSEYIIHNDKFDIIPSNINLAASEVNLREIKDGEKILSELLEPLRPDYDYIIIDSNPFLGLLTINALTACDEVVIPVSPEFWSATGLTDLLQTIYRIKRKTNPKISVAGVLMTMCNPRTRLYKNVITLISEHYGDKIRIFSTSIPSTTKVGEANFNSSSIIEYYPKSKATIAYKEFALEVANNAKSEKH